MSLDPCRTPHPTVPNVADLTGENAALRTYLDRVVIALARAHGVTEDVIRVRMGLPQGNPWRARRPEQAQETPQTVRGATIYPLRHPRATPDQNGPQIEDYAI